MKARHQKIIVKSLLLSPLGMLLLFAFTSMNFQNNWLLIILGGIVFGAGTVFFQMFDYDKFDDISDEDYLESKHTLILPNTPEVLAPIDEQTKGAFADVILTDHEQDAGTRVYEIEQSIANSFLTIEFKETELKLIIKKKRILSFLPDKAANYRIIHRLKRKAEKMSNNG